MKKLILCMHTTLDGFVAGPNGEMDWINVEKEIFEEVSKLNDQTDTALFGRKTFSMMESYWPTAGEQPNASKHDIEHSAWYKKAKKVILSRTMESTNLPNVKVISKNLSAEIRKLKQEPGKDIVIFGSAEACHSLMEENLIDDYLLLVNPVLLGEGIPLFKNISKRTKLKLVSGKILESAVMLLHYQKGENN